MSLFLALWTNSLYCQTIPNLQDKYCPAIQTSMVAAQEQSGFNKSKSNTQDFYTNKGEKAAKNAGIEKELAISLGCYKLMRDKAVSFPLSQTVKMSVGKDKSGLTINF